jgi:hypothetical protein
MGKVICALANGTVAVFKRDPDGQWDLTKYHSVCLGSDRFAVRCLAVVNSRVWCGYKNKIHILEPKTLTVLVSCRHLKFIVSLSVMLFHCCVCLEIYRRSSAKRQPS